MNIAILGGTGLMGSGIARDVLSDRAMINIDVVRICESSRERIERLTAELGSSRVEQASAGRGAVWLVAACTARRTALHERSAEIGRPSDDDL